MKQELTVELPKDELAGMVNVARRIVGQPGVPVSVPRDMVHQVESVLQRTLSESLMSVRERERSTSAEAIKLRFR